MAVPFAAGQEVSAADLNFYNPLFAIRTADSAPVNNSTVLVNDTQLFLSLAASATYEIVLQGFMESAAAAGFKYDFGLPSGATYLWGIFSYGSSSANLQMGPKTLTAQSGITGAGTATTSQLYERFFVSTTNAGTLQYKFAQQTANASNTVMQANSTLVGLRRA